MIDRLERVVPPEGNRPIALGVGVVATAIVAAILGLVAGWTDLGFGPLALTTGPCAGLVIRLLWQRPATGAAMAASGIALLGVVLHLCVIRLATPAWSAEACCPMEGVEQAVRKVIAARICRERRVVVIDYDSVPDEIRREADEKVREMTRAEQLEVVNRLFGKRMNERRGEASGGYAWVGVYGLGAMVLAFGSVRMRLRRM